MIVNDSETTVGEPSQARGVGAKEPALPPHAFVTFLLQGAEPILPEHSANNTWRRIRKGIASEEPEHGMIVLEEKFFGSRNNWILLPRAK
jgi:hypothetical protein